MATFSGRSAVIGLGRQTAEGSALTVPKFEIAMGAGYVGPAKSTEELPWTNDSQDSVGHFVSLVSGNLSANVPVLPKSFGAILQGVLGARNTTGAGPYTHAITPSDALGFYTYFFRQPGDNYWTVSDVKHDAVTINWAAGQPLNADVAGTGKNAVRAGTKWGAATVEEGVDPFYTYIGATMKIDHSATPATTTVGNIPNGSLTIARNLNAIQTDDVTYSYMAEQKRALEVALNDVVLENNDWINVIFTGTTTGTSLSGQVIYGALEFTFLGSDQAAAATRSLKVSLPRVLWAIDEIPGANPDGSTTTYALTGAGSKPSSGSSITATLINSEAGTNY
jgi:tail tube protein